MEKDLNIKKKNIISRVEIAEKNKLNSKRPRVKKQNYSELKSNLGTRVKKSTERSIFLKKLSKVLVIFIGIFVFIGIILVIWGITYLNRLTAELPSPDKPFRNQPTPSVIYDRKSLKEGGTELYKIIGEVNSDTVDIGSIPEYVKWAFLAAEDIDFYSHYGYDLQGIVRCGISYIMNPSNICGGSTITQQLIKTTALSSEVKLERKIKELFLSTKVEQEYDKSTILQMYLQVAPFGSNIVGIETASHFYFRKKPSELTLAQGAVLASIVQSPAYLSPTKPVNGDTVQSQKDLKERQLYVIAQMEKYKDHINSQDKRNKGDNNIPDIITDEMLQKARDEELKYSTPIASDKKAGHFVDFVMSELLSENYKNYEEPFTLDDLQNGGYKIYTTLDYELQKIAENTVKDSASIAELGLYGIDEQGARLNMHNSALMTLIPKTGEIITMAGSKDFNGESEGCDENGQKCMFNGEVNILNTLQSPGSTNKPLAYYLAYSQGKLAPGSNLPDVPLKLGEYEPKNWDGQFKGPKLTAKEALRSSRNIPALIAGELAGIENYISTALDFGYTSYEGSYGPSVVLGGATVYPIEHAQAYAVFANGGDFVKYESVLKILDKEGNLVYEAKPEAKRVGDPQAVYLLNQTLYNLNDGRFDISWDGRAVAGKTGTSESAIDNWLVMYSPDFVTLGWAGNNNNDPLVEQYGYPTYTVSPWLKDYMSKIGGYEYFSKKSNFEAPAYVYYGSGCSDNKGCVNSAGSDWLIQDKLPPIYVYGSEIEICTDQTDKKARPIDIALGYSKKIKVETYQMPVSSWQKFLDTYLIDKKIPFGNITEECDISRADKNGGHAINLFSPLNYSEIGNGKITIEGSTYVDNLGIRSIKVYMNDDFVGNFLTPSENFKETFDLNSFVTDSNKQKLTVVVTAFGGDEGKVDVILVKDKDEIVVPEGNVTLRLLSSQYTYGVTVGAGKSVEVEAVFDGFSSINGVTLFELDNETGKKNEVGEMSRVGSSNVFSIKWGENIKSSGTYVLSINAILDKVKVSDISNQLVEVK